MNKNKRFNELKEFSKEVLFLIRRNGRSSLIPKGELEEICLKYNINLKDEK